MKVCEKVQAKGSTSYNEVADELVRTCFPRRPGPDPVKEKSNVVYFLLDFRTAIKCHVIMLDQPKSLRILV